MLKIVFILFCLAICQMTLAQDSASEELVDKRHINRPSILDRLKQMKPDSRLLSKNREQKLKESNNDENADIFKNSNPAFVKATLECLKYFNFEQCFDIKDGGDMAQRSEIKQNDRKLLFKSLSKKLNQQPKTDKWLNDFMTVRYWEDNLGYNTEKKK